ncbi:hypothetical protein LSCM1_08228 [Leishmania martiniquensis]|uniref:C3H1-type domain-containing protein n=1 Tax=Leishmania martiniquensis TaxID=1580590 RepID=A0A836L460_9TRYP|nr:hypothetical protein LSCM1_08228 [Leishmania martiniquensis]
MERNSRHMNPLAFDDDGGRSNPQRHRTMRQNGASCGSAAANGARTAVPLPVQFPLLESGIEAEETPAMAQRSPQPRTSGFRGAARRTIGRSGGDDDPLDAYTSSASSSTTSPQWHRHNPYRALSTSTSTPAHSPRVDDSGSPLTLPDSLVGPSSNGCGAAPQHLNVALHLHTSRGNPGAASGSDALSHPQQALLHQPGHAPHTLLSPKSSQTRPALSRTSSAASSSSSSHYSCSDRRNSSSTGFLPDVDVVEGSTSSSGVFFMQNYQFRLSTYDRSGAASSSETTPHSYTTADRFFEETGGFTVDDDDGIGSDSRRRSTTSRSSPYDMDYRQGSVDADGGYSDDGTAPLSLDLTARGHAPRTVSLLLSSLGRSASALLPEGNAQGPGPLGCVDSGGAAEADKNSGQSEVSAGQGPQRPMRPPSTVSSTGMRHGRPEARLSAAASDSENLPTKASSADPAFTRTNCPEVEPNSHPCHPPQPQTHLLQQHLCTSSAAPPHVPSSAAAPGFTGTQLTELLEAHLARTRGGNGGECGEGGNDERDEVWCPAGSQFSVYDSGMREHYLIKSEQVAITRGAIKYVSLNERYGNQTRFRFQLCNRYLHHRCFSAAECQYIHSLVVSTATQVHMNENSVTTTAVRRMNREELAGGRNTLDYPTMGPGMIFAVYPPNQLNSSPQLIRSELILTTAGAMQTYQALSRDATRGATHSTEVTIVRPRHCAHFQFKRMCNLGTSCHFIHSLIPFVQGMVNQPLLPPSVDVGVLNNAAGVVLPPNALGTGSIDGRRVGRRVGRAPVTTMTVPSLMQGQAILPVWPTVTTAAQEAMFPPPPSPFLSGPAAALAKEGGANAVYARGASGTRTALWKVPQDVKVAAVCAAGASPYQAMFSIVSTEPVDQPAAMMQSLREMQRASLSGFDKRVSAMEPLSVLNQRPSLPQPLLVGMPSFLAQRPQSREGLPTHHHAQQRCSSLTVAELTSAVVLPQGYPSEAHMRRKHT